MQTFLPYSSFQKSAEALDRQRLGKQRVECLQILKTLRDGGGWANHPAVRMWRGAETHLCLYSITICDEWIRRGYKDTCCEKIIDLFYSMSLPDVTATPSWLGNEDFHRSHRANLVRKDPAHYVPLFGELEWEPYVWPLIEEKL